MEGAGNRKARGAANAVGLRGHLCGVERGNVAADHDLPGRVQVRDGADAPRLLPRGGTDRLGNVRIAPQGGETRRRRLAGLLHAQAALTHEHQRVGQGQSPGEVKGRELPERQAEGRRQGLGGEPPLSTTAA